MKEQNLAMSTDIKTEIILETNHCYSCMNKVGIQQKTYGSPIGAFGDDKLCEVSLRVVA